MRRALLLLLLGLAGCESLQLAEPLARRAPSAAPAPPLVEAWRRDVQGGFGSHAPVVAGDLLLLGTRRGDVAAVDRATGRVAGLQRFGESVEGALAVGADGRTLYVPSAGGGPGVTAYDARAGNERWRWPARGATREVRRQAAVTGGVALVGDVLVAATAAGVTVGLDATTGAERWRHAFADTTVQVHAAPVALAAAGVLVAGTDGSLVAREAATGALRWTARTDGPVYETPAADAGLVAVTTTRGRTAAFDAVTGATRWTHDAGADVRLAAPALGGERVVVGGTDGTVRAFDAATGREVWTWSGDGAVSVRPLVAGGLVYVGTQRKRFVALDAATGAERWTTLLDGRVRGAPVAADGAVYVLAEPRHVYAFRPAGLAAPSR